MKQKSFEIGIILFNIFTFFLIALTVKNKDNDFNSYVLNTIMLVDDGGGYYTGRAEKEELDKNAWEGMDEAVNLKNGKVNIDLSKAKPSFCSSAVYMVLSKIYRAVSTHIDNPVAFNNVKKMKPDDVNAWLSALDGKHLASEVELIQAINGEKIKKFENK